MGAGEEGNGVCEEAVTVVVPGPGCPPAESTWPGLHFAALHSHSAAPPETHRAATGERRQHEARTQQFLCTHSDILKHTYYINSYSNSFYNKTVIIRIILYIIII